MKQELLICRGPELYLTGGETGLLPRHCSMFCFSTCSGMDNDSWVLGRDMSTLGKDLEGTSGPTTGLIGFPGKRT